MTSAITEEAIRIINAAPSHGPLQPAQYAKALPPRAAALALLLKNEKIAKAAEDYSEADASAGYAQERFKRLGWTAAYSGFLAAFLGGVLLYLGSDPSTQSMRTNLGLLQSILLGVSLFCAFLLFLLKPYREWRVQRGDAEVRRLQIFALMMSDQGTAGENEVPLPCLSL